MKNTTRIGSSILGTWSSEVNLVDHKDGSNLTAYFLVHFMADPRKQHGCLLEGCNELDNNVCMLEADLDKEGHHIQSKCNSIALAKDVTWSDLNAFFYFGVKINSTSKPKAKFELSTGEWIGPFNMIMAQDTTNITSTVMKKDDNSNNNTLVLVDRYVARYVESQSTMPVWLQNKLPLAGGNTLYTKPDDFTTFLGNSVLANMKQVQINYTIPQTNTSSDGKPPKPPSADADPYKAYLQNCDHGNLQPILPLIELEFFNVTNSTNTTTNSTIAPLRKKNKEDDNDALPQLEMALKLQYKIMAVPTPDEQAYRVLPQLQSKFQNGQNEGAYNIISGPYCYGDDENRGYSFDISLNSWLLEEEEQQQQQDSKKDGSGISFVRGCLPGYNLEDCFPPAAMGGLPLMAPNHSSCDDHRRHDVPTNPVVASNVVLMFVAYTLGVALLISITIHMHVMGVQRKKEKQEKKFYETMGVTSSSPTRTRDLGGGLQGGYSNPDGLDRFLGDHEAAQKSSTEEEGLSPDPATDQREDVNPFGDLDEEAKVDPLQEPLLPSSQDDKKEKKEEANVDPLKEPLLPTEDKNKKEENQEEAKE